MKDHIHIEGVPPYDGDHEIDFDTRGFTNRELHTIKRLSGVRANELAASFAAGDNDLNVAMVVIALERNGHRVGPQGEQLLWDASVDAISIVTGDEEEAEAEDDVGPPSPRPIAHEPPASEDEPSGSSGTASNGGGDHPASAQSRTGTLPSVTGAP